jgi:hypothetical protein
MTPIIVTHILPSATAFGATASKPTEGVFIPSNVSKACHLVVGQEVNAKLVPNTMQPERTPWLAVSIEVTPPAADLPPLVGELVSVKVQRVMKAGGVWSVLTMFEELFPNHDKNEHIKDYNAISSALRAMFARGDCAKFQLWRSPDQSRPGREWFTCYPERADVDEWLEIEN